MAFTRSFAKAFRGGRPSTPRAMLTAAGAGGAVAAGVYRFLRR